MIIILAFSVYLNSTLLTKEAIGQGKYYYSHSDDVYRENMMVENFIREFDKLSDECIMGIYGSAHTGLEEMDYTNTVPSMANQLMKRYGDTIFSEDLSKMAKDVKRFSEAKNTIVTEVKYERN